MCLEGLRCGVHAVREVSLSTVAESTKKKLPGAPGCGENFNSFEFEFEFEFLLYFSSSMVQGICIELQWILLQKTTSQRG